MSSGIIIPPLDFSKIEEFEKKGSVIQDKKQDKLPHVAPYYHGNISPVKHDDFGLTAHSMNWSWPETKLQPVITPYKLLCANMRPTTALKISSQYAITFANFVQRKQKEKMPRSTSESKIQFKIGAAPKPKIAQAPPEPTQANDLRFDKNSILKAEKNIPLSFYNTEFIYLIKIYISRYRKHVYRIGRMNCNPINKLYELSREYESYGRIVVVGMKGGTVKQERLLHKSCAGYKSSKVTIHGTEKTQLYKVSRGVYDLFLQFKVDGKEPISWINPEYHIDNAGND